MYSLSNLTFRSLIWTWHDAHTTAINIIIKQMMKYLKPLSNLWLVSFNRYKINPLLILCIMSWLLFSAFFLKLGNIESLNHNSLTFSPIPHKFQEPLHLEYIYLVLIANKHSIIYFVIFMTVPGTIMYPDRGCFYFL